MRRLLKEAQDTLAKSDFWIEREAHKQTLETWELRYAELERKMREFQSNEAKMNDALVSHTALHTYMFKS